MSSIADKIYIRYAGLLHPDGQVTLIWMWKGQMKTLTYPTSELAHFVMRDDIAWLIEIS